MNKVYIYIKNDLELGAILEKVKITKEKEIVLVIPENTKALLHPTNLEIFKNEIEKMNKKVFLSTDDEKLKTLALNAHIPLFLDDQGEQQIIDIKPPNPSKKNYQDSIIPSEPKEIYTPSSAKKKKKVSSVVKSFFVSFFVLLIILGTIFVGWQQFQARASLIIIPEKKEIDLDEVITLNTQALAPDYDKKELPADLIKLDLNKVETITTTGKIFSDDQPLLKVSFLNYLDYELPLRQGTRVAYKNNIFKIGERIILPPKNNQGPGEVTVVALPFSINEDNLIIPKGTTLNIPALQGVRHENGILWSDLLKAKVAEDYDSSNVAKIGSVSPEDVTTVKLALENSLKNALKTQLAIKYSNYFYPFDQTLINFEVQNISHKVGEKTDKISATGRIEIETLGVNKKTFYDFVKNIVNKEILAKEEKLIVKTVDYEKIVLIDFNKKNGTMSLGLTLKAVLEPDLNPEKIKLDIKGKDWREVKDFYLARIIKTGGNATIKIFPPWKSTFPSDPNKIKIIIQ
jgi:hypothetical protein